MTLLIACLLIHGLDLSAWWYALALPLYVAHVVVVLAVVGEKK